MGILLGVNIKNATWFNPGIAAAQAEKTRMETAHQQEVNKLEEQLAAAKTDAEVQAVKREQELLDAKYEHDKQILAQDVINRQRMADTVINLVVYLGTGTGVAAALAGLIIAIAKAIAIIRSAPKNEPVMIPVRSTYPVRATKPISPREDYDPLESPAQRYERRLAERQQELTTQRQLDEMIARMKAVQNHVQMSKKGYKEHPLAGD